MKMVTIINHFVGICMGILLLWLGLKDYPTANLGSFALAMLGAIAIIISIITFDFKGGDVNK